MGVWTGTLSMAGRASSGSFRWSTRRRRTNCPSSCAPGMSWSGVGVVFAIPALLLYSTGFELLIMFRSLRQQVVTTEDLSEAEARQRYAHKAVQHTRDTTERLHGLKVNGRSVTQLGEQFNPNLLDLDDGVGHADLR